MYRAHRKISTYPFYARVSLFLRDKIALSLIDYTSRKSYVYNDEESKILRLSKSDFTSYVYPTNWRETVRVYKLPIIHSIYKRAFNSAASLKDYSVRYRLPIS